MTVTTLEDVSSMIGSSALVESIAVSNEVGRLTRVSMTLLVRGEALSTDPCAIGWTPCSARCPSTDDDVLVCLDGAVSVGSYWGDGQWSVTPAPTHWRNLPLPPRSRS